MKIIFNDGEQEFPVIRASENYISISNGTIKKSLQISLYNDEEIFNNFMNYINNNKEFYQIDIYNNINKKIYTTTTLVKRADIYRSITDDNSGFITIDFIENN